MVGIGGLDEKYAHSSDEGGRKIPFLTYFTKEGSVEGSGQIGCNLLVMEVLDVKECPWPEPSKKVNQDLCSSLPDVLVFISAMGVDQDMSRNEVWVRLLLPLQIPDNWIELPLSM